MAIQLLRGTTAQIAGNSNTSIAGQPLYDIDKHILYVGDGETAINELEGTQIGLNIKNGETTPTSSEPYINGSLVSASIYDDDAKYTEAQLPVASGHESFAFGKGCKALGKRSFAFGNTNTAEGNCSFTIGQLNTNKNNNCFVLGKSNKVGNFDDAWNLDISISDISVGAFIGGLSNKVSAPYSITSGTSNKNRGHSSILLGQLNTVEGNDTLTVGAKNNVGSERSITAGYENTNDSFNSLTAGWHNRVYKENNITTGWENVNVHKNSIIAGFYNDPGQENTVLLQLGNGDGYVRSNAFEVLTTGQARVYRKGTAELEENDLLTFKEILQRINIELSDLNYEPTDASNTKTFIASQIDGKLSGEYVDISIEMNQVRDLESAIGDVYSYINESINNISITTSQIEDFNSTINNVYAHANSLVDERVNTAMGQYSSSMTEIINGLMNRVSNLESEVAELKAIVRN